MTHQYPTRFQTNKCNIFEEQDEIDKSITRVNDLIDSVKTASNYTDKLEKTIHFYLYLYHNSTIIKTDKDFRDDIWNKMIGLEEILLSKLQKLPINLTDNDIYDVSTRSKISYIIYLIEKIRIKYW